MDPLLQSILNSGFFIALLTGGLGLIAKILDVRQSNRVSDAKTEIKKDTQQQSTEAVVVANEAKHATDDQESRIQQLEAALSQLWAAREVDRQLVESSFENQKLMRAQYSDLEGKYYVLRGQNAEQAEQITEMQEHGKRQDILIDNLLAWQHQATLRMDELESALNEAMKVVPIDDKERIEGLVKTPRPKSGDPSK